MAPAGERVEKVSLGAARLGTERDATASTTAAG
jgi:hypothetical protein